MFDLNEESTRVPSLRMCNEQYNQQYKQQDKQQDKEQYNNRNEASSLRRRWRDQFQASLFDLPFRSSP